MVDSATVYAPLDIEAYRHQAVLLKALHCAHPVLHKGALCFIQTARVELAGGRVEMTVYLTGSPEAIESSQITIAEQQG